MIHSQLFVPPPMSRLSTSTRDRLAEGGLRAQLGGEFVHRGEDGVARFGFRRDGQDDDLRGRDARRQHEAVVVGMRHDDACR